MRISLEAWSSRMRRPTLKLYCLWGTGCGAIKGAIDHVELGNLTGLLAKIKPAVDETQYAGDRSSKNYEFVDAVAKTNRSSDLSIPVNFAPNRIFVSLESHPFRFNATHSIIWRRRA